MGSKSWFWKCAWLYGELDQFGKLAMHLSLWLRTHFLKGVVTGSDRLRLDFITNGFNRICGPSDERGGNVVIGGGGGTEILGGVTGGDTGGSD